VSTLKKSLQTLASIAAVGGMVAGTTLPAAAQGANPCAPKAKRAAKPCAPKGAKAAAPCGAKAVNPCSAKTNPCAGKK
jgi:hypothetical protein